jgi:hypothetical protein
MTLMTVNNKPVPFPWNLLAFPLAFGIMAFVAFIFLVVAAILLSPVIFLVWLGWMIGR